MAHDPSDCPFCRWAAERLKATKLWDGEITRWIKNGQIIRSFCASLDAVVGLMKEMQKHGGHWAHFWLHYHAGWGYTDLTRLDRGFEFTSPEDLPAQCVIAAAMQVLGEKESDG